MTVLKPAFADDESGEALKDWAETVKRHVTRELVDDDIWFLVSSLWWEEFELFTGLKASKDPAQHFPGPVDNAPILTQDSPPRLRPNLVEEVDFGFIHEDGWALLCRRFGVGQDSALPRKVYEAGLYQKQLKVEVELLEITFSVYGREGSHVLHESRGTSFKALFEKAAALFPEEKLGDAEFRAHIAHSDDKFELMDLEKLVKGERVQLDDNIYTNQHIVLERKDSQGNWAVPASFAITSDEADNAVIVTKTPKNAIPMSATASSSGLSLFGPPSNTISRVLELLSFLRELLMGPRPWDLVSLYHAVWGLFYRLTDPFLYPRLRSGAYGASSSCPVSGLCGLTNLGNTCFMNSALQCLSNCPPLTEYFLSRSHEADLNERNPLGMGGRLAQAYAGLIHQMWKGGSSSAVPREFKSIVGQFAPTFSGYHQQDSQELMAFLLDGLHEDLNRVKDKPYVAAKEAEGRPDEIVAEEAWTDYLQRNQSVIVDLFHGQLKSTLVCPIESCGKVSIKFDPFCYLSLPLPVKKERHLFLTFVGRLPEFTWTKYKVSVPKLGATDLHVRQAIGKLTGESAEDVRDMLSREWESCKVGVEMVMAEVTTSRVHKVFHGELGWVSDRDDLYVFQVDRVLESEKPVDVFLYQRYQKSYGMSAWGGSKSWVLTATPICFRLPSAALSPQRLYAEARERASKVFGSLPAEGAEWWAAEGGADGADGDDSGVDENEGSSNHSTPMDTEGPPESGSASTSQEEGWSGPEKKAKDEASPAARELFSLRVVNAYGSVEQAVMAKADAAALDCPAESELYVAADWDPQAYDRFAREAALTILEDSSVTTVVKRKPVALSDCLRLFQEKEQLGKDDLWYCPDCKEHREASKQMEIWSAPKLLIVHLKRFSYSRTLRDKLEAVVDFPLKGLDMGPYMRSNGSGAPVLYDLISVSNHMGGLGGGHYTAFGLNSKSGRWHLFDDSCVSAMSEDGVVSKMAYVLFYMRRDGVAMDPNIEMEECSD